MNQVYRIVWSHSRNAWVVVSDLAKRRTKRGSCDKRRRVARIPALAPASVFSMLAALPVPAADVYWDPNGTAAGRGGAGDWDSTSLFWRANADGTSGASLAWNNSASDHAIFGAVTDPATVTLTTPITLGGLTFESINYTLIDSTLTLEGAAPTIGTTTTAVGNTVINSILAGSDGVTFTGSSINSALYIGGANTLTGGSTIDANARVVAYGSNNVFNGANNVVTINGGGVLQVENSNAFGGDAAASRLVMHDGATLNMWSHHLTHDITATGGTIHIQDAHRYWRGHTRAIWTGNLVLTADTTLAVTNSNDGTVFAGNLSDTGPHRLSLVLASDVLWLDGTNTFTGGTTVNGGTLVLRGVGAAGGAGNIVTVNSGGVLQVQRSDAFNGDTAAANLIINDGARLRVSVGTLAHDVTLTGGTAYLDGAGGNTWNGTAVLTADTVLRIGDNHTVLTGDLSDNGAVLSVTLAPGDIWFNGGTHSYSGDTIIGDAAELVLNSAGTLSPNTNIVFDGTNTTTQSVISLTTAVPSFTRPLGTGAGDVQWSGSGGFYARNNTADSVVNLFGDGRTLTWGVGGFVPDGDILILGTNSVGSDARQVDFQNGIDLSGGTRVIRADNGNANDHALISGVLSGTGGLQLAGSGMLELSGANTYSGPTIVGDGANRHYGTLVLGTSGPPANSNLQLNGLSHSLGNDGSGFVLMTPTSGDFTMPLGTGAGQVQWLSSGGFGAYGGERTVNLGGAGATLSWGAGGFVPDGQALRFNNHHSNSIVNWANGLNLGAAERTVHVWERVGGGVATDVRLDGVIEGTGSLHLNGGGDVELNALNTFGGALVIGNGPSGGDDDGMFVYANTLANDGLASSLGGGDTVVLSSHLGGLIYTGVAVSTDRDLVLEDNNTARMHLLNRGSGALTWAGNVNTAFGSASAYNRLMLGGTFATADANGDGIADDPNVLSGVISDGLATLQVTGDAGTCGAGNVWRLTGANTFTGRFGTEGCVFEATTLANGGAASSIGASSNDVFNLDFVSDGTLRYIGSGDSTDRLFRSWGNGRIESSGTGALAFTNTGLIVTQNGGFTHWLAGTNTDDNTFAPTLVDSPTPVEYGTSRFSLGKDGPGLWALVTDNNARSNAYSANTRILGGALRLDHAGAITGGLGVSSSHGVTGSAQRSSLVMFEGLANGTAGVLGLTAASGGFFRGTTAEADAFLNNNSTNGALDDDNFVQGVRWWRSGGFAAWDGVQTVNLFGDGRALTWGSNGFVPNAHHLVFGYQTATGTVDFRNAIELGNNASRTFDVRRGLAQADAIMSGAISGTGSSGIVKNGDGILLLTADNSFSGNTALNGGVLQLGDGGTTGSLGSSAQVALASGTTLIVNRSDDALTLNAITDGAGGGTLHQLGSGTTTLMESGDIDDVLLQAGTLATPGTGKSFAIENVTYTDDGGATLQVRGTLSAAGGTATSVTGGILDDTLSIDAGATSIVNGGLGDGNDVLDVGGTVDSASTVFALGEGNDRLVFRDGAILAVPASGLDAGNGSDTIELNSAAALTFAPTNTANFEVLDKTGAGTATLSGVHSYTDVNVNDGVLDVDGTLEAPTIDLADGATLNVDGTVQAAGATRALITGDAGANTVTIGAGGTLSATGDLGDGADVLDVVGTIDLGGNTFALGAGNDTLTVNEDTNIAGLVDGGAGNNTLNTHITGVSTGIAVIGAIQGFDILDKTGAGTLNIVGAPLSTFEEVQVSEGMLDIGASGSVTDVVTGAVLSGATLNVDGSYIGTTGADTFTAAGAVTGAGAIDLGDGDDRLIVQDTGDFSGYTSLVDGGTGSNTVELNSAAALSFDPTNTANFQILDKTGAGTASLTGAHTYTDVNVNAGVLDVDGSVETSTIDMAAGAVLNVDGTVQATGATQTIVTGDTGASLVTIAAGGTLLATGDLGGGADVLNVVGTLDTGTGSFSLGDGDDSFVVHDGTNIIGTVAGGAGLDTRVYDLVGTATVGAMQEFEGLAKRGIGTLTLSGPAVTELQEVRVEGGTLNVGSSASVIGAATTAVSAGAILNIDGAYGGSTGADTFTVAGTVQGTGAIDLDGGDDEMILQDGADLDGLTNVVEGGAGTDTVTVDITGAAELNAVSGFENLVKQNTGTLNINGPATSGIGSVNVQGGVLNVGASGSIIEAVTTTVANGATLNVDGVYQGTTGADTFTLAGTVSGVSSVQLGDGDDVLTLREGAALVTQIDGGAHTAGDTLALDISTTFTFDGGNANGLEVLAKQNTGTAILTNVQSYASVTIDGGTLDVDGTLETATVVLADATTLHVDGTMQSAGATVIAIAGSAGANTVSVGSTGMLMASGGLGDGADTLDVGGTLDLAGGSFDLGAGDDFFVIHDGTNVLGTVVGGAGLDTRVYDLVGTADIGALQGFEGLTKRNTGALNITGPASTADLVEVSVEGGVLSVWTDAHVEGVQTALVAAGATLSVDGEFLFTAGADALTVGGTVAGTGVIDLLDGDDLLTLLDTADTSGLAQSLEGGAGVDTLTADIATSATLGSATGFETLVKQGAGALKIVGPTTSVFDTVHVREGLLEVAAGVVVDPETTVVDAGTTLQVDGTYEGTTGADTFTLSGTLAGAGTVDLLDGDDLLTINTGATVSFAGPFDASAGADRFVLAGTDSDSFDLGLIGTKFQNFETFHKEGAGTWRLTGAGDRNWTVSQGTLIGDSASFGGDIDNAATVVFDQAADGTYEGMLSGAGTLIKQNAGTLILPTEHTFAGTMEITGGALQVDGVLPGAMLVAVGGTLSGTGTVGNVTALAGGFVRPGNAADPFGTLTIAGNYTGGGTVLLDTELGDELSATSRLMIQGDVSGSSAVLVNQSGGAGARTRGDGIELIQVDGASSADSFQLSQPVQAGAYQYFLHQGGESDANDWYLRSEYVGEGPEPEPEPEPSYRPGVAGYVLGHQASLEYGFAALGSLRSRVGSQEGTLEAQPGSRGDAWMRMSAHEIDASGTQFEMHDLRMSTLQFGADVYRNETARGATHFGAMANIGQGTVMFFDRARANAGIEGRAGEAEMDVKGVGLYWTHHGARGGYLDLSSQVLNYRNRYKDQFLAASTQRGWGGSFSAELGAAYALGGTGWKVEPQLQLVYQRLELEEFTDEISSVSAVEEDALRARAGLTFFYEPGDWLGMSNAMPYIGFGVQRDLRNADSIAVGGTELNEKLPDTTADASLGLAGTVGAGFELHLDVRYQQATDSEAEKDGVRGNFGFRKRF